MGQVLKVDAAFADADAYAVKDLGSAHADVWVTMRVYFPAASLTPRLGYGGDIWIGKLFDATDLNATAAFGTTSGTWATFDDSGTVPAADRWITLEYHQVNGGTSDLYVNNVKNVDGADSSGFDTQFLHVGFIAGGATGLDPSEFYIDDVTVGTTRGDDDLFSDDFESGDLSSWTSTSGTVSVIDDPTVSVMGVAIAFDDTTLEPDPEWTNLNGLSGVRVTNWSVQRGRSNEFEKMGTGTATVRVIDEHGLFDPTNSASAYFGKILPDKQAAISLYDPVHDEWHTVFRGYVENWNYTLFNPSEDFFELELELVDGFAILNDCELMPGVAGTTPPAGSEGNVYYALATDVENRLNAITTDAGWPLLLTDFFTGNVSLRPTVYAGGTQALSAAFDACDGEFPGVSVTYMSKDGIWRFRGRQPRFRPAVVEYGITEYDVADPSVTDGDATVCPVHELSFNMGKDLIYNSVLAYPQDAAADDIDAQLVEDATSISAHGKKSLSFTDLLTLEGIASSTTDLQETKLFAEYYKDNYATPHTRVNRMVFKSRSSNHRLAGPLWKLLTRIELSDLLNLTTDHPASGGFSDVGYFVEGIRYDVTPASDDVPNVTLELDVSPQALYDTNPFDSDPDP